MPRNRFAQKTQANNRFQRVFLHPDVSVKRIAPSPSAATKRGSPPSSFRLSSTRGWFVRSATSPGVRGSTRSTNSRVPRQLRPDTSAEKPRPCGPFRLPHGNIEEGGEFLTLASVDDAEAVTRCRRGRRECTAVRHRISFHTISTSTSGVERSAPAFISSLPSAALPAIDCLTGHACSVLISKTLRTSLPSRRSILVASSLTDPYVPGFLVPKQNRGQRCASRRAARSVAAALWPQTTQFPVRKQGSGLPEERSSPHI